MKDFDVSPEDRLRDFHDWLERQSWIDEATLYLDSSSPRLAVKMDGGNHSLGTHVVTKGAADGLVIRTLKFQSDGSGFFILYPIECYPELCLPDSSQVRGFQ